jgi:hypothetical protein
MVFIRGTLGVMVVPEPGSLVWEKVPAASVMRCCILAMLAGNRRLTARLFRQRDRIPGLVGEVRLLRKPGT